MRITALSYASRSDFDVPFAFGSGLLVYYSLALVLGLKPALEIKRIIGGVLKTKKTSTGDG